MLNSFVSEFKYGKYNIKLETGLIARQSTSAVLASMDDTTVLVSVVVSKQLNNKQGFFPLTVNYQERAYAVGKFPGGFFRREGRPNENEMLISRLIDRSLRPIFDKNFFNDIQIIITVLSANPNINPDLISIIGSSAAISLSGVPFNGPIGIARVGLIDDVYILNPSIKDMHKTSLDLVISSTIDEITMVESSSKILKKEKILEGIMYGHEQQKILINNINKFVTKVGKKNFNYKTYCIDSNLKSKIYTLSYSKLKNACSISNKIERLDMFESIKSYVNEELIKDQYENIEDSTIENILNDFKITIVRNKILKKNCRIDSRSKDEIRDIDIKTNILPRTHGSALFTRGDTQALVTVTLGTNRDAQNVDELINEKVNKFLLHYNFPPYCVGEIGIIGVPKRREIGHGNLAKRGLISVMPDINKFPYTIRVVSEITESNGSSSMASVCGASLALMDAGVPIKSSIAGIAMGLIKENDNFVVLSDILGDEDYIGDMDFKVIGSREGITALQMDIKISGINKNIIEVSLNKAMFSIKYIIDIMENNIKSHRKNISKFAPRIHKLKINPDKIKDIIGKGGSIIRSLTESTNTTIDIENDGIITIASINCNNINKAINKIKEITTDIKVGGIYEGKVKKIVDFGAFVTILALKEGLLHISQITEKRIEKISNYLTVGQTIQVKVIEIDHKGRIRLSMKDIDYKL
ncbi:MAG: polyribonucleotide nucleotidyltransferase [Enterobacterales bacterium]